jgi:hypothetical protein
MKQMRNGLLAILFAGGALASCSKDKSISPDTETEGLATQSDMGVAASRIESPVAPGDPSYSGLSWTEGFIHLTGINFTARQIDATGAGKTVQYGMNEPRVINLFRPADPVLMRLPAGVYENADLNMSLAPTNNLQTHTLYLRGAVSFDKAPIPVVIVVNQPVAVRTNWPERMVAAEGAALRVNLSALTRGISPELLRNATMMNGQIEISNKSNAALFEMVVANMQGMVSVESGE